ncbi:MAG TPA: hypothetical protein VFN39_05320 [Gemmatimonadaceae bacterium]|nr:hypothetical protein [Gemmatimonadaceae bacterium]
MTRIKLLLAIATAVTAAQAVHAQSCNGGRTFDEVIAACDEAFTGYNPLIMSARGWCYIVNGATCLI